MSKPQLLSFVVPVKDEEKTIRELYTRIAAEVGVLGLEFELIFIDDGSTDTSWAEIEKLNHEDNRVSGIKFRRNIGKANALTAGFEAARGDVVFTMDADLQDDPKEIGRFLEKLEEGFDVVSGWKQTRHDPWHKVLPSRVFNKMISNLIGVRLHDHNCGFKCYRSQVVKDVTLYGEMHRMVPSLASLKGYRSSEIPVQHHPRLHGQSKYGVKRFLRGFMDMCTVYFLKHFKERPLHLFGGCAVLSLFLGAVIFALVAFGVFDRSVYSAASVFTSSALPLAALGFFSELMISRRTSSDRDLPISARIGTGGRVSAQLVPMQAVAEEAPLVLVVDDDPTMRVACHAYLTNGGYRVKEASNGVEALAKLTLETSVVLLDMLMPDGNGLDALKAIRNRFPGIKVVMLSGLDKIDSAVSAMKLGAFDYLAKPVRHEQLLATVSRAVQIQSLTEGHLASA